MLGLAVGDALDGPAHAGDPLPQQPGVAMDTVSRAWHLARAVPGNSDLHVVWSEGP
jgi:hypothetical protein